MSVEGRSGDATRLERSSGETVRADAESTYADTSPLDAWTKPSHAPTASHVPLTSAPATFAPIPVTLMAHIVALTPITVPRWRILAGWRNANPTQPWF